MTLRSLHHLAPVAFLALLFSAGPASAQWTNVGAPGFSPGTVSGGVSNWQQLAVSPDDTLYVSFNDEAQAGGKGTVMKYNGTNWVSVGTPGFTPDYAHHSSFALGADDTVYFAFADGSTAGQSRAAVMRYNGTNWTPIGASLSTGSAQYTQIRVDAAGTPFLSFIDMSNSEVKVMRYNGTAWVNAGSNAVSAAGSAYTSLRFDNNGVLHIAFQDGGNAGKITVKKLVAGAWTTVGSSFLEPSFGIGMEPSLAFSASNVPHVAYWNPAPMGPKASVHKFDGAAWTLVGAGGFTTGIVGFTSLAFHVDTAYLAFHDQTLGTKATVMKYNGTSWVNVGTPGFTPGTAAHTSLAINGNGNLFVAFYDQANSGKTSVMTLGSCVAPTMSSVTTNTSPLCKGDTATLTVTGTLNGASKWYWYAGNCGGTPIDSGASIQVAPTSSTIYHVRALGGCVVSGGCQSVLVPVVTVPTPIISVSGSILTSSSPTGNQWMLGGTDIPSATNFIYTAQTSGWYRVRVTFNGCSALSDSVYITGLGVNNTSLVSGVTIYPSPFTSTLNVRIPATAAALSGWSLSVTDNVGRTLYTTHSLQPDNQLSLPDAPAGLYFVILSGPEGRTAFKVTKAQ